MLYIKNHLIKCPVKCKEVLKSDSPLEVKP